MFDIIVCDPPWDFKVWNKDTGSGRSAVAHYKVMTLDDICGLPVADVASKNCALFLWSVWPRIFDAQQIIEAWGFEYKTLAFEWIKTTSKGNFHFGMGYYFRANPEPCLLAIKGRMPVSVRNERNLMFAQFQGHSCKPREAYQKIENVYPRELYPNRLEMFASNHSRKYAEEFGYVPLGFDIDGMDISESLWNLQAKS